jgi:Zn-dependent alcohol dehydrogenase
VGQGVTRFKQGDPVGVGCMVDSCRQCKPCEKGTEQYCEQGSTFTYGGVDRHDHQPTQGGYSEKVVVSERGDGHEDFANAVAFADYDDLADRCAALVKDDEARRQLGQRGFEVMAGRSESEYLKAALFIA